MIGGYMGKILRVDLSKTEMNEEKLNENVLRKYVGGVNLALKILYEEVSPGIDSLDPENRLIFMTAPLVGTITPAANQYAAVSKSPLTGFLGFGRSHGFFAPELKFAGYDGLIVQGRSETPVFLWIHDGKSEIKEAKNLWGRDTYETEDLIRKELGDRRIRVACIGQAGESISKIACIMNDRGHAAARCGIGTVMGSKNLKAIAVRGTKKVPVVDEKKLLQLRKKWHKISSETSAAQAMSEYGTAGNYGSYEVREASGDLPTKNWTTTRFPEWRKLSGEYMKEKYVTKKDTCFNCHIGHDYVIEIPSGPYAGSYVYPEYEDTAAFGSNLGISNTDAIIKLTDMANRYGMDSVECSHAVSFAMECYEKGVITKEDTGGVELTWGNAEAVMQIMDKIVKRDGIGDFLSEGVKRAADLIGAPDLAVHIKKLSPILHDLRHDWGWLLSYAVSPAGPVHLGIATPIIYTVDPDTDFPQQLDPFSTYRKGEAAKKAQLKWVGQDCLGVCVHAALNIPLSLHVEFLSAATGWDLSVEDFLKVAEREITLARAFNIRHGLTPADDWPSKRILEPPHDGPAKGMSGKETLLGMLEDYYCQMGWDPRSGKPWRKTLLDLGLEDVAKDIWSR